MSYTPLSLLAEISYLRRSGEGANEGRNEELERAGARLPGEVREVLVQDGERVALHQEQDVVSAVDFLSQEGGEGQ